MLMIVLSVIAFFVLVAEFWLGIAVIGWTGERLFLERSATPGPYWMMMVLHTAVGVGLPVLAYFANG